MIRNTEASQPLIILGMHRSGTSLLASWLQACGLFIGQELMPGGIGNEKGHFEDERFVRLHRLLLNEPLPHEKQVIEKPDFNEVATALIATNQRQKCPWGWKDPRTCLFIDDWHRLLPQAQAIVVFRSPELVVDSLMRRYMAQQKSRRNRLAGWFNVYSNQINHQRVADAALQDWIRHNRCLLDYIAKKSANDYVVVELNDLLTHDLAVFNQLRYTLGIPLHYKPIRSVADASLLNLAAQKQPQFSQPLREEATHVYHTLQSLSHHFVSDAEVKAQ